MKITNIYKLLFATACSIIISACGGTSYDYAENTQDLAQCLTGDTWEHTFKAKDGLSSTERTFNYYEDGTYLSKSVTDGYSKTTQVSVALLALIFGEASYIVDILFSGADEKYIVRRTGGKWETEGGVLYITQLKSVQARGYYKQATLNEVDSTFESSEESTSSFPSIIQVHCDDHHLDSYAWELTNSAPPTYKHVTYDGFLNGEVLRVITDVLTLNDDGTASMNQVYDRYDQEPLIFNTAGFYEYVVSTSDEPTAINYTICNSSDTENCIEMGTQTFYDHGTAISEQNFYYTR